MRQLWRFNKGVTNFDLGVTNLPCKPLNVPLECMVAVFEGLLPHTFKLPSYRDHLVTCVESHGAIRMPNRVAFVVQFEAHMRCGHATVIERNFEQRKLHERGVTLNKLHGCRFVHFTNATEG